jgi:hypothetical protein
MDDCDEMLLMCNTEFPFLINASLYQQYYLSWKWVTNGYLFGIAASHSGLCWVVYQY